MRAIAPAKVNLGLRVVGRRPDGYHELDSVFAPLDLGDALELRVEPAAALEIAVRVTGRADGVPADASNLAARAARAFAQASGLRARIAIRIDKRIPHGAGLGGGSSDAAAVLRALRDRDPGAVGPEALARIALGLGADVPFFVDPRPCRVTGIGERLEPISGAPALPLLLVNPGVPLATAEVFRAFDALSPALTSARGGLTIPPLSGADGLSWEAVAPGALAARNDLEPAATRLCPPVARVRERIRKEGARAVGMSGSGPTVFGIFDTADAARAAMERIGSASSASDRGPAGASDRESDRDSDRDSDRIWAAVATTVESR